MANTLTGDYDAVVQVRIETVNRILATMHQNGLTGDATPTFPHSLTMRLGDISKILQLAPSAGFAQLALSDIGGGTGGATPAPSPDLQPQTEAVASGLGGGEGRRALRAGGKKGPPPGVTAAANADIAKIAQEFIDLSKPGAVRGTARVQLSTPTISMPLTSVSQVTAKVQVRAHYTPDPGTVKLRQPVHGEVRVTFSAEPKSWGGKRVLDVKPVEGDDMVVFLPAAGAGLTDSDTALVTQEIRRAVKNNFEPINVELPADLKLGRFKRLGSGSMAAIALPIDLPGGSPAPGSSGIDDVNLYFLKSGDHFAVAVSKEYIESTLQSLKAQIDNFQTTITVEVWLPIGFLVLPFDFDYHVTVSSPILTWQNGSIKLTVNGSATATDPAPDYSFTIEQLLTLTLNTATQKISLQAVGDASISGLPDVAVDPALDAVRQQRDAAIDAAQPAINAITGGVDIDAALGSFNAGATSRLTAVDVTPAGLIVRGTITVRPRIPAVVEFAETGDGTAFTALKTWIPAGTIERYEWAFEKENPFFFVDGHHLEGTILSDIVEDNHGFIVPIPDTLRPHGQVCLTVHGTQIGPRPAPRRRSSPDAAGPGGSSRRWCLAGWGATAVVPVWRTAAPDALVENAIAAHVNAFAPARTRQPGANALVYFADAPSGKPLEVFEGVLAQRTRRDPPVGLIVVLPVGSLREKRAAICQKLGSPKPDLPVATMITEDYGSGWSKTFGVTTRPATYLMDAQGQCAWQHEGPVDAAAIAAALKEHAVAGGRSRLQLLRPKIQPGDRAPDALFEYEHGERIALRKLAGRAVALNFWKSWSAPCIEELGHLQRLHDRAGKHLVIVAINDGEDPECVEEIRRTHHLTLTLVSDPERKIALLYDVSCWPTTVWIDATGVVNRVQLGVTSAAHQHTAAGGLAQ